MTRRGRVSPRFCAAATAIAVVAAAAAGAGVSPAAAQATAPQRAPAATTSVLTWGDNSAGELGNGTLNASASPLSVAGLNGVQAVASSGRHNLALRVDGTVVAWGDNTFGQLGDGTHGTNNSSEIPVSVKGLSGVSAVSAGGEHSLALLNNGTVMAWGDNGQGQLGNGTTISSGLPVAVKGLSGVTAISAGNLFNMALLSNGTVMTWGSNNSGQLGNGTNGNISDVPIAVPRLTGVKAVAAGLQHSLALLNDGSAKAWGDNGSSQLGDGDSTHGSSPVPVKVKNLKGAVAIAGGSDHSVALLGDGTVMVWGGNGFFQLARPNGFPGGVGTSNVPLVVNGIAKAKAIAAGGLFTLTVTTTGTVQGWGDDAFGQLGDGKTSTDDVPVTVPGLNNATAVAAGGVHSMALVAGASMTAPRSGVTSSVWRVQQTQNPGPPSAIGDFSLESVSAVAANEAWSVGTNGLFSPLPLAEHWNGTAWKAATVPMPAGAAQAFFNGVDELSRTDAWAVGTKEDSNGQTQRTLIEHWDGTKWTVVPSPNPVVGAASFDELQAVGGTSANDLWAVGDFGDGVHNFIAMLFEHWDGTKWSFVPPPTTAGVLLARAVTAVSSTDVWVVGDSATATISANWNGKAWKLVPTPILMDGNAPANFLTGVTASGPNDVWASGYEDNVNQQNLAQPYVLHWTGASWTLVKLSDPGTEGSRLRDITALSPSDVWAVGQTQQTDGGILTLTEQFNGTTWSVAPSLDPGQLGSIPDSSLGGVSTFGGLGGHGLFTVGAQETPGRCCLQTLAEGTTSG